jgi:predicted DsbA family dithiol-disulfide isomerase
VLADWIKERFEAEILWAPFDLHPEYPAEGIPREQLVARYGPDGMARTAATFEHHGLSYNPNPEVVPNSMKALRLAEHARAQGLFDPMHERLMDAYWAEAQNIADPDVLRALARDVGLSGADEILESDAYVDVVRASTQQAHQPGINGIPAFAIDSTFLVLGAQPRSVFEQAFAQLHSERSA